MIRGFVTAGISRERTVQPKSLECLPCTSCSLDPDYSEVFTRAPKCFRLEFHEHIVIYYQRQLIFACYPNPIDA